MHKIVYRQATIDAAKKTPRHALLKKRVSVSGEARWPNNCAIMMPVACDHCMAIVPATIIHGITMVIAANSFKVIFAYINSATLLEKVALINVMAIGKENRNCCKVVRRKLKAGANLIFNSGEFNRYRIAIRKTNCTTTPSTEPIAAPTTPKAGMPK